MAEEGRRKVACELNESGAGRA